MFLNYWIEPVWIILIKGEWYRGLAINLYRN